MNKPLASRIVILSLVYIAVFFALVIIQFSDKGDFTLMTGEMTIKGHYLMDSTPLQASLIETEETEEQVQRKSRGITGGIKISYGGLEFNLRQDGTRGLVLTGSEGVQLQLNPRLMTLEDSSAGFEFPGGTTLLFSSFESSRGPELHISAEFADNITEAVIPIRLNRSSIVNEDDSLAILYNGARFQFSGSGQELDNGKLILSAANKFVSYRSRENEPVFNPSDFIIEQAANYNSVVSDWIGSSYAYWTQNSSSLNNDDDISAYCSEAMRQGNYTRAVASVPRGFLNSSQHTHRSSGFVGGMTTAYRSFTADERSKNNLITNLARERSPDIFNQENILDFLLPRNYIALVNDVIDILHNFNPEQLTPYHCPGLLETHVYYSRWRPSSDNPVEPLIEPILLLVSQILNKDNERNYIYAHFSEDMDEANSQIYNLRLGKALTDWAQISGETEWAQIGRSLVISALGSRGPGSGRLFNFINPGEYFHRATLLSDNGMWVWTVSPSVRVLSTAEGNLNVNVSFRTNMAHYMIIRGVRPFVKIQLHGQDWRTDSQFERYDSSGWVYYPQEQILVVKLRHRAALETVALIYREDPPLPASEDTGTEAGQASFN
ncbi:MAG: hypothetical protein LBH16_05820 [Treponema sp.]|nr:hypothetical protein [Treponema sp.]